MASNPTAVSAQYQYASASPLDRIMNGNHPDPPQHASLDGVAILTRQAPAKHGECDPAQSILLRSTDTNTGHHDREALMDSKDNIGYALGGENTDDCRVPSADIRRQTVQNLRAARLSQQKLQQRLSSSSTITPESTSHDSQPTAALISNAFRDSVASDMSFNSISGSQERDSMVGNHYSFNAASDENDSDRVAEAIRGLALRRRQSIDTVRSSEFGEGGKWDRAWGGSDEEDEEEEDDDDEYASRSTPKHSLPDFEIGGKGGALDRIGDGQWQSREDGKRRTLTRDQFEGRQLPVMQNMPVVEHKVSLTPSMQRMKQNLAPIPPPRNAIDERTEAGSQPLIQRRDTMMSMMGDVGQISPTHSRLDTYHHRHSDSNATLNAADDMDHRSSYSSESARSNAHVYVWPPTPAASEYGGSSEERGTSQRDGSVSNRDTLLAYPAGVGIGQRARVEYAEERNVEALASQPISHHPMSPSAALARPLDSPILGTDGKAIQKQKSAARVSSGSLGGHPTGRQPPEPPTLVQEEERYSDPNKVLPNSPFADLGKMRRKAIEDRDGRESLVSDLDVETLRLDDSSIDGDSEEWNSRRGSNISLGSFSSEKIREQRQRRSQASMMSSLSDKRSSSGTIQDRPRSPQKSHQSWNGVSRQDDGQSRVQQAPSVVKGAFASRSPVVASAIRPLPAQAKSASATDGNGSSLTFTSPRPKRETKDVGNVAVKGATNNSQAERFLTLAITHHETGDLSRSAYYFERSAKVEGGCVVGMCMWGMALREGWGVRKDQTKGFDWISRAATRAGEMMAGGGGSNQKKSESELKAIRSELKLSVYELGKCFCYGWGVKLDKTMALEYFELAAKLGDSDAQAEAGALLTAGKGCKKDLKRAAMYYRMAEAQGYDTVGLSWIHKDKYD
ncbi:hypothetical protein CBS101457_003621 [Exobasidium rhododendri]|nr:hypothetical protein CBS101457_003621 [Exobasidium rhododendri]